jgi:DNA-binding response OmpR family regulator
MELARAMAGAINSAEHIYRVRRKLIAHDVTTPRNTTVRGFGYRLDP